MAAEAKGKFQIRVPNDRPAGQSDSDQGKYLYCVIKESKPQKFKILRQAPLDITRANKKNQENKYLTGQEGKEVYIINKGGLAMAVTDTAKDQYSFIKEHLTRHQKVIEEVMKQGYDVLPVRFGTVAKSAEDVKEKILKPKRKEFLETFPIVEGRVELGIRAFWKDMPSIFQEIVEENQEIQIAKRNAQKNPHQFRIAGVGELIPKAVDSKREREAGELLKSLKELAVKFKERELIRFLEPMRDSMIFSYAFLVSKKNEREFDKRVHVLIKKYNKRIKFIYIGPIPAFNFVELHLKI